MKNDKCLEVRSLEEIVDIIEKDNIKYNTISLELVKVKETFNASTTLHNFMLQFKKKHWNFWMQ